MSGSEESGLTAELEPAEGCAACGRLQVWARSSWARGHQMGMAENRRIAREATEALRLEREAHAETNARLTEALLSAEDKAAKWKALAESNAKLAEISQRRTERESRLGIEGSNVELTCRQQPAQEGK